MLDFSEVDIVDGVPKSNANSGNRSGYLIYIGSIEEASNGVRFTGDARFSTLHHRSHRTSSISSSTASAYDLKRNSL